MALQAMIVFSQVIVMMVAALPGVIDPPHGPGVMSIILIHYELAEV